MQYRIILNLQFSNLLFSSVFRKVGKIHFCFASKEIFSLDDPTLCHLGKFFSFLLGSPTSDHTESTFDVHHKAHLAGVTLSLLPHGTLRLLPLPSSSTFGYRSQKEGHISFCFQWTSRLGQLQVLGVPSFAM